MERLPLSRQPQIYSWKGSKVPSSLLFCLVATRCLTMHPTKFLGCNSWWSRPAGLHKRSRRDHLPVWRLWSPRRWNHQAGRQSLGLPEGIRLLGKTLPRSELYAKGVKRSRPWPQRRRPFRDHTLGGSRTVLTERGKTWFPAPPSPSSLYLKLALLTTGITIET